MNTKTETNNRASFLENVKELAKVKRKSYFILFQKLQEAGCATDKASGNFVAVLLNKSIKKISFIINEKEASNNSSDWREKTYVATL